MKRTITLLAALLIAGQGTAPLAAQPVAPELPAVSAASSTLGQVPLLAYYYIWFDPTSWNRAKTDLPLAGKYSSDERRVMTEHVITAKRAGITGFIVSWKHTAKLDRRLHALAEIAGENGLSLMLIYQGLDFDRKPLPTARVQDDLNYFISEFAALPAFQLFDRPAVALSGSWEFSADDVRTIKEGVGNRIMLLGTEKNIEGIQRLAGASDGNAYYWSSVDPSSNTRYVAKLQAMGEQVHAQKGLWIAPAAPGFDARQIGGESVVERKNGDTLRAEMRAAADSSPDAIGLISWNEFSENSHIEPSRQYGTRYVEVVAEMVGGQRPPIRVAGVGMDSSEPGERGNGRWQLAALAGAFALVALSATLLIRRRHR